MAVSRAAIGAAALALALVIALAAAAWIAGRGGSAMRTPQPMPAFTSPLLADAARGFAPEDLRGQVWVLNLWASWCVPCREEHPVLLEMARRGAAPLVGLNYRDTPHAAKAWLRQYGDPFDISLADDDGRVAEALGLAGVPATLVVDRRGLIRHVQAGAASREHLERVILPLIRELQR